MTSGPATVSGSTLTITGAGSVVVAANQAGNTDYAAATAVSKTIIVNPGAVTSKLTTSAASVSYGASVTLTATFTGKRLGQAHRHGYLLQRSELRGTGALNSSGVATLALATLPVGANSLTASFPGDTHYAAATTAAVSETVSQATPTVKLASSAGTAAFNASVTLTATLTGATGGAAQRHGELLDRQHGIGLRASHGKLQRRGHAGLTTLPVR